MKEVLSHCLGNSEAHQIQTSRLWAHLEGDQGEGGAYIMSGGGLMCREREGRETSDVVDVMISPACSSRWWV